jgi:hypothetical protein
MHWLTRIQLLLQREFARLLPHAERRLVPVPVRTTEPARRTRKG